MVCDSGGLLLSHSEGSIAGTQPRAATHFFTRTKLDRSPAMAASYSRAPTPSRSCGAQSSTSARPVVATRDAVVGRMCSMGSN